MHLLKIEFAKVRNYKTFWVFIGLYIVLVPLWFYGFSQLPLPFFPSESEMFSFPTIWNYITWIASWWNLLMGVLVVVLTCNEITFRTQRQNIIDGMNRRQMILSKFYFLALLGAFVTFYTFLIGFVFGVFNSDISEMFSGIKYIGVYFVQTLGYFAFAFMFAVLVKNSALSIILYIVCFIFSMFIPLMMDATAAQFMPLNSIQDLTPFPFFQEVMEFESNQDPNFEAPFILSQTVRSLVALGWTSVFVLTGYFVVKRRDL